VKAPGEAESIKTKVLEKGADVMQNKPAIEALNAYLDGFHFYNGNPKGQMEERSNITSPPIDPGADAWQNGNTVQIRDPTATEQPSPHGAQTDAARPAPSPPAKK
jgi:hypothetical protein